MCALSACNAARDLEHAGLWKIERMGLVRGGLNDMIRLLMGVNSETVTDSRVNRDGVHWMGLCFPRMARRRNKKKKVVCPRLA